MPTVLPLGDRALLVRFADHLSDAANLETIGFARHLAAEPIDGVAEIVPGLVSVMLRLDEGVRADRVRGELSLRMGHPHDTIAAHEHELAIHFDGEDVDFVAAQLGMIRDTFVARHNAVPLRVLATGFAPGFVYCGLHPADMVVARREQVRPMVPAGTVLFAAGQTAIAATPIRTGWHVIGSTAFRNFDPAADPPTTLRPGDLIRFTST